MFIKAEYGVADQIRGCFMSCHKEQDAEAQQFHVRKVLPVDFSFDGCWDQGILLGGEVRLLGYADNRFRPLLELPLICDRYAQQFRNHRDWQWESQVADH